MKNYMDFKAFRKDVDAALAEVCKKYGISMEAGTISYDHNSFTMKMTGKRTDVDVDKNEFESVVPYMHGFQADDYMKEFTIKNKAYQITGFKPGNKYCIVAKRLSDGHLYGFIAADVLQALGR